MGKDTNKRSYALPSTGIPDPNRLVSRARRDERPDRLDLCVFWIRLHPSDRTITSSSASPSTKQSISRIEELQIE
jgi:hypothetical protein